MITDAHIHVKFKNFEADDVIAYLDKYQVGKCWLLTWEEENPVIPENYLHLSIEDVFAAYQKFPSRIIPMYAPDPASPDFEEKMIAWYKKGIRGCGELKVSLSWNSNEIDRLLTCINNLSIPLVFHMEEERDVFFLNPNYSFGDRLLARLFSSSFLFGQPRKMMYSIAQLYSPLKIKKESISIHFPGYLSDFPNMEKRLQEYPNVAFIGHGPLFWKGIAADWVDSKETYPKTPIKKEGIICKLLSEYDNLYADISGTSGFNALNRDKTFARKFLSQYETKILFGTDNYELGLIKLLHDLELSSKTYSRIFHENATDLLINEN